MFTGLVEEVGKITSIKGKGGGLQITVSAKKVLEDTKEGDSIAVDGVCLTVVGIGRDSLTFDVSQESIQKSTLKYAKVGRMVNLERAVRPTDRLGGHIVQGHVDTVGNIKSITPLGEHTELVVSFPSEYTELVVEKGSIAIDGISLTINNVEDGKVGINIIPHTFKTTNLNYKKVGDPVNIEFDIIGKYVAKML
jgi:riboflavin synthase